MIEITSKRKSCPVKQRPFLELDSFNKEDKTTYDGTETVRELNKFDKKWFYENSIAVVSVSKTSFGKTFVIPYIDIDGVRYWLVDKIKKDKKIYWDMINYVKEDIMEIYDYSEEKSIKLINNSCFKELLKDNLDYVCHYNVEYWAKWIVEGDKNYEF